MDWNWMTRHRLQIGAGLCLATFALWYWVSYLPRSAEHAELDERTQSLDQEITRLAAQIAEERKQQATAIAKGPSRVAPALAGQLSEVERLRYFLENITGPANELDLNYFTVTPLAPKGGPGYEEIPFSISVAGRYAALADFLYQLEYQRDFVVRTPALSPTAEGLVKADFELAAIVVRDGAPSVEVANEKDPGRPTSLELARDPFTRPPAKLGVDENGKKYFLNVPPGLELSGVMHMNGRRSAIINHEPYHEGQTLENKTISRITDRGVEMKDDVRSYFLEMERPPFSTTQSPTKQSPTKEASAR